MKKALAIIAAACAATYAYGQGTIAVENVGAAGIIPVYLPDGTTKAGVGYKAALFLGNSQIGADVDFKSNGRFAGGSAEVPGVALGNVAKGLVVKVWDSAGGKSYADSATKGTSGAFDSDPLGGGSTPPPKLANLKSFNLTASGGPGPGPGPGPGTVIPEPSTVALGALGAAALLFARRRS